jgi:hypothetical protein
VRVAIYRRRNTTYPNIPPEAALARAQGQRNAAESALPRVSRTQGPAERSVARPRNMSKITIAEIRDYLGLAGVKHDEKWADLRVRDINLGSTRFKFVSGGYSSIHGRRDAGFGH